MNKSKLNYLVDLLAFLFFVAVAFSGLAIFFLYAWWAAGKTARIFRNQEKFLDWAS
jgi:hypothetical protein